MTAAENPAVATLKELVRTKDRLIKEEEQKIKNSAQIIARLTAEKQQVEIAIAAISGTSLAEIPA